MGEATVNGVRLAYQLHGQGEPVVFLPATGMVKEAWLAGPAPAVADAGYQVVLVDSRGAGGSAAPPAPYTVADLAADTVALIELLGLGRCRLVGLSLGGFVAEHLAAERADLVRAVVLLSSAGPVSAYGRLWMEAELEAARQGFQPPHGKEVVDLLGELLTPTQLQADRLVQAWAAQLLARRPWRNPGRHGQFAADHAWIAGYQATHAQRWARISVPLLAVAFEHDLLFPPSSTRQLTQAVAGAELAVIPGAGHGGTFTHTAAVSEVLVEFFASVA